MDFNYSDEFLDHIADIFKAFGNTTRLKIFRALHNQDNEGLSVNVLQERVGTSQANISKHLKIMEDQGLVGVRSEGTTRIYFIADEEVTHICRNVCDYLEDRLDDLATLSNPN